MPALAACRTPKAVALAFALAAVVEDARAKAVTTQQHAMQRMGDERLWKVDRRARVAYEEEQEEQGALPVQAQHILTSEYEPLPPQEQQAPSQQMANDAASEESRSSEALDSDEWAKRYLSTVPAMEPHGGREPPLPEPATLRSAAPSEGNSCDAYLKKVGCAWTKEWSCPGQPRGLKGVAGGIGARCCCNAHDATREKQLRKPHKSQQTQRKFAPALKAGANLGAREVARRTDSWQEGSADSGCASWCSDPIFNCSTFPGASDEEMNSWKVKCSVPECDQCDQCKNPPPFQGQCGAAAFLDDQVGTCADWCGEHKYHFGPLKEAPTPWAMRCRMSCCDGCNECFDDSIVGQHEGPHAHECGPPAGVDSPGVCSDWCASHHLQYDLINRWGEVVQMANTATTWSMRCNFRCCEGCSECEDQPPSPPPQEWEVQGPTCKGAPLIPDEPGVCATWCPTHRFGSLAVTTFGVDGVLESTWQTRCQFDCCRGCHQCDDLTWEVDKRNERTVTHVTCFAVEANIKGDVVDLIDVPDEQYKMRAFLGCYAPNCTLAIDMSRPHAEPALGVDLLAKPATPAVRGQPPAAAFRQFKQHLEHSEARKQRMDALIRQTREHGQGFAMTRDGVVQPLTELSPSPDPDAAPFVDVEGLNEAAYCELAHIAIINGEAKARGAAYWSEAHIVPYFCKVCKDACTEDGQDLLREGWHRARVGCTWRPVTMRNTARLAELESRLSKRFHINHGRRREVLLEEDGKDVMMTVCYLLYSATSVSSFFDVVDSIRYESISPEVDELINSFEDLTYVALSDVPEIDIDEGFGRRPPDNKTDPMGICELNFGFKGSGGMWHSNASHQMMEKCMELEGTPYPPPPPCDCGKTARWTFRKSAEMWSSNLGGCCSNEPDAEQSMRYHRIIKIDDSYVDLLVTNTTEYVWDENTNGLEDGVGRIGMRAGHTVKLKFRFVHASSYFPITLSSFYWTVFNLDEGSECGKSIVFNSSELAGYDDGDARAFTPVTTKDGQWTKFSATSEDLTYPVTFKFEDASEFTIDFRTYVLDSFDSKTVSECDSTGSVSLIFSGGSSIGPPCPLPEPSPSPVPSPAAEPSSGEESPESCSPLSLDFSNAKIENNNLGGYGPDTDGPQNLRLAGAGSYEGNRVDLVVTAGSGYEPWNTGSTMLNGKYAQINLKAGKSTDFTLCFEDSVTKQPVTVEHLGMTFHDFDGSPTVASEQLTVSNFESYQLSDGLDPPVPTQLKVLHLDGGRVMFESTEPGLGSDNARDPDDLTDLQKSRMVALFYEDTACVTMTFAIHITSDRVSYGRNFLFSHAKLPGCAVPQAPPLPQGLPPSPPEPSSAEPPSPSSSPPPSSPIDPSKSCHDQYNGHDISRIIYSFELTEDVAVYGECIDDCYNYTWTCGDYPGLDTDQLSRWKTLCTINACSACEECREEWTLTPYERKPLEWSTGMKDKVKKFDAAEYYGSAIELMCTATNSSEEDLGVVIHNHHEQCGTLADLIDEEPEAEPSELDGLVTEARGIAAEKLKVAHQAMRNAADALTVAQSSLVEATKSREMQQEYTVSDLDATGLEHKPQAAGEGLLQRAVALTTATRESSCNTTLEDERKTTCHVRLHEHAATGVAELWEATLPCGPWGSSSFVKVQTFQCSAACPGEWCGLSSGVAAAALFGNVRLEIISHVLNVYANGSSFTMNSSSTAPRHVGNNVVVDRGCSARDKADGGLYECWSISHPSGVRLDIRVLPQRHMPTRFAIGMALTTPESLATAERCMVHTVPPKAKAKAKAKPPAPAAAPAASSLLQVGGGVDEEAVEALRNGQDGGAPTTPLAGSVQEEESSIASAGHLSGLERSALAFTSPTLDGMHSLCTVHPIL